MRTIEIETVRGNDTLLVSDQQLTEFLQWVRVGTSRAYFLPAERATATLPGRSSSGTYVVYRSQLVSVWVDEP